MDHKDALWCVQMRVDRNGNPLFKLENQRSEVRNLVDDNLVASIDAESGICCFEYGSQ